MTARSEPPEVLVIVADGRFHNARLGRRPLSLCSTWKQIALGSVAERILGISFLFLHPLVRFPGKLPLAVPGNESWFLPIFGGYQGYTVLH